MIWSPTQIYQAQFRYSRWIWFTKEYFFIWKVQITDPNRWTWLKFFEDQIFYFLNFFTIFKRLDKFVNLITSEPSNMTIFNISEKIVKNFKKNVKFGLQRDFNIEIMFNGSDRSFELFNWRNDDQAPFWSYLIKYHKLTLSLCIYIYIYIYIYI